MARSQNTIVEEQEFSGKGLFTGEEVHLRLRPADPDTGIMFMRVDLPDSPVVPALTDNLADGFNCSLLRQGDVQIRSVEHLLSACMGMRVDNLLVEIDGEELPEAGGGALDFAHLLKKAGIEEQNAEKTVFEIKEPVAVSEKGASVMGMPGSENEEEDGTTLTLSYILELDAGSQGPEVVTMDISPDTFIEQLAPARTWSKEEAYDEFEKRGYGGGVTDENALVIFEDGTIRKPLSREEAELRFPDEFARHKLLDLLGDLGLSGVDIIGKIVAVRSGHKLNTTFAGRIRNILAEQEAPEKYLDIREIQRILPHRYPFLLVDRVLRIEEENKIVGIKNVSINEHFFQGHYPDYPIMPGVLQIEALAQISGVLLLQKLEHSGKLALMVGMDGVRLRKPVQPGDQLVLEAEAVRVRSRTAQVNARGLVDGDVACEAEMKFMLVEPDIM